MKARKPKMMKGMKMSMGKGKQFKSANVDEVPMRKGKKKGPSDMGMLQQRMPR